MLVNLLSKKSFLSGFFLVLLFLAFLGFQIYPVNADVYSISAILILLLSSLIAILFYNYSNLITYPGFGIWFFLIWTISFSDIIQDLRLTAALFCSILFFLKWFNALNKTGNKRIMFETGFLLICTSLLFPPSIFLILFLLISYFYTQTISLKGFLLLFIGLVLPLLIGLQILFLTDHFEIIKNYEQSFYINFWNSTSVIALIPVGVLILFSWLDHLHNYNAQDINKRHRYFLAFIYFINCLAILILFGGDKVNSLLFLGFPVSIFLSRFVQYQKSDTYKELWLWLFAIFMAIFIFRNELIEIYNSILGNVSFGL